MQTTDYTKLIEAAVTDVESGRRHACRTTRACQEASGCPRCLSAAMKGLINVERIEVYRSGTVTIRTAGHDGQPCTVAFRNVEVTIHE
jgi:hypothetical protein